MSSSKSSTPKVFKSSSIQNKSTNNNMVFKTFKLTHNSKLPSSEWKKENKHMWAKRSTDKLKELNEDLNGINYGIPCGMVNKITVVDMDLYKIKGDSEFITKFGENYINTFNTFTVKTTSGGEHLYFNWDKDIPTTTCNLHQIDIRANGSYCVAPGSSVNRNPYTIINDTPIITIPEDLKQWLLLNIYRQPRTIKIRVKKDKNGEVVNPSCKQDLEEQDEIDLSSYNYDFSDIVLENIIFGLPDKYFNNYEDYLIFTTCMKTLNKKEIWEDFINDKVDSKHHEPASSWGIDNGDAWSSVHYKSINTLPLLLRESSFIQEDLEEKYKGTYEKYSKGTALKQKNKLYEYLNTCNDPKWGKPFTTDPIQYLKKSVQLKPFYEKVEELIECDKQMDLIVKKFLGYYMYKPTDNHTIKPDKMISNQRYLDGDTPGSFCSDNTSRYLICKSDTGTGKTTAVKNYFKKTNDPFISTVSRLSLGCEQNKVFIKCGLHSNWFKDCDNLWDMEGTNMVIQIDSLAKVSNWDFSGYTIYLDEFNSLIEYFIDCPTLNDKRVMVKKILEDIIRTGERIIMTDAHISDTSLLFLEQLGVKDRIFIENDYKHNKGITATELFSDEEVLKQLKDKLDNNKPFMVCCDSKNVCDVIYHKLDSDKRIGLFTSETLTEIDLDAYDFVIFSPKVVYGLDSLMKRPVYCVMKEHTITPDAMLQQANRCRNITELKYFFARKSHGLYKYKNREEVYDTLTARENNCMKIMECIATPEESEKYKRLLAHHLYNIDCLNTNKFAHFIRLLKGQGFTVDIVRKVSKNELQKHAKEVKLIKISDLCDIYDSKIELMEKHRDDSVSELKCDLDIEIKEELEDIEEGEGGMIDIKELEHIKSLVGCGEKGDKYFGVDKEDLLNSMGYPQYIVNNIKLLKIQPLDVYQFATTIIDSHKITRHYLLCRYFFKDESDILKTLQDRKEFNCKKGNNDLLKIMFLKKVLVKVGLGEDMYDIHPKDIKMSQEDNDILLEEYNIIFNNRSKKLKLSFMTDYECEKMLVKMFKNIFGAEIIISQKTTKIDKGKIKCITVYELGSELIKDTKKIYLRGKEGKKMYREIKY